MYVIAVYDICTLNKEGRRRIRRVMKIMRKYFHHTQKSVFEGETTEAKYRAIKSELKEWVDEEEDYVVFYRIDQVKKVNRETMGKDYDPTSVII